jgi:ribosomal protein L40E
MRSAKPTVGSPEDEFFLQPWFISKAEYAAIRRSVSPTQILKMRYYFDDYGCIRCGDRNAIYGSNGLCRKCSIVIRARLALALKRRFRKVGFRVSRGPFDRYLRSISSPKDGRVTFI